MSPLRKRFLEVWMTVSFMEKFNPKFDQHCELILRTSSPSSPTIITDSLPNKFHGSDPRCIEVIYETFNYIILRFSLNRFEPEGNKMFFLTKYVWGGWRNFFMGLFSPLPCISESIISYASPFNGYSKRRSVSSINRKSVISKNFALLTPGSQMHTENFWRLREKRKLGDSFRLKGCLREVLM